MLLLYLAICMNSTSPHYRQLRQFGDLLFTWPYPGLLLYIQRSAVCDAACLTFCIFLNRELALLPLGLFHMGEEEEEEEESAL